MELREGMYVRTKKGKIGKVIDINLGQEQKRYILDSSSVYIYDREEILKASNNIIDLIEVGDYVNGFLVVDKYYDYANKEWRLNDRNGLICTEKNIKSIVTKEQFENVSYKVGDKE